METNKGDLFVQRIKEKVEVKELEMKLGISAQTVSHWKQRGTIPSADVALKIANYLGVTVEYLVTGKSPEPLSGEEMQLLRLWREQEQGQQDTILALMQINADNNKKDTAALA